MECFAKKKEELEFVFNAEQIPGFDSLTEEEQDIVKKKVGKARSVLSFGPLCAACSLRIEVGDQSFALPVEADYFVQSSFG